MGESMSAISLRKALPLVAVFAVAGFLLLARLGSAPLDEAEARCAVVARDMLRTGRALSPAFFGRSCWGEPLVGFWQLVAAALAGGPGEFSARLPSVLWAFALLLLTYDLGRRWFGEGAGLVAAGVLATTYAFVLAGRSATGDAAGAVAVALGLWCFERWRSSGGRAWPYCLGVILGLGGALAGSGAYVLGVVCIVALSAARGDFARMPRAGTLVLAFLLSLAAYLALPALGCVAASSFEPLAASLPGEVARRFSATPVQRYASWNLLSYAPWSLLLPIVLLEGLLLVRHDRAAGGLNVALAGIALVWPARDRLGMVATAPLVALVMGGFLVRLRRGELPRWASVATRVAAVGAGLALVALVVGALLRSQGPGWLADNWQAAGLAAVGGAAAVAAGLACRPLLGVGAAAAALVAVTSARPLTTARELEAQAATVRCLGRPICFVLPASAQAAYYLDASSKSCANFQEAARWASRTRGIVVTTAGIPDPQWSPVVETYRWQALEWRPREAAMSLTRDPAWLARHPLRALKSETLTYTFSARAALRFNLGTVTMKLFREDTPTGRQLVITAESKGGVPGYPMASVITSRLRDSDLAQLEADDLRTKPSYKHRRFRWTPDGVLYHRHDHCKDKTCRNPEHMITRPDGTRVHCFDKRCGNLAHRVWKLKQAFRQPGAADAYHVVAACYIARGFDLAPGAPPQRIRVINNQQMWDVALRGVEEKTIEVPAGTFQCVKLGFDPTPLNAKARETAEEAEGPFGLTGHADLYVDKATGVLVLLDGHIALGATFKVQVMLTSRRAETLPAPPAHGR